MPPKEDLGPLKKELDDKFAKLKVRTKNWLLEHIC
jgi:hypothetical protein